MWPPSRCGLPERGRGFGGWPERSIGPLGSPAGLARGTSETPKFPLKGVFLRGYRALLGFRDLVVLGRLL